MSANIIRKQLLFIGYTVGRQVNGPDDMEWSEWPRMSGLSAEESRRVFAAVENLNWVVGFPNDGWITYKLTRKGAESLKDLVSDGAGAVQIDSSWEQTTLLGEIDGSNVFIVHSDDPSQLGFAQEVNEFISSVTGSEGKFLEPAPGKTLWNEFEKQASDCKAAVCIWSKDRENPDSCHIRPNVLLETGYFLSRLGHGKVIIIREDDNLKGPSDLAGIVWANKNNWRLQLPAALREALAEPLPELPPIVPGDETPSPTAESRQPSTIRQYLRNRIMDEDDLPF